MTSGKIEEVEYLGLKSLLYLTGGYLPGYVLEWVGKYPLFTGSGRAALRLILEFFRDNKRLPDKNGQVLVPHWLCYSALNTMQKYCSPTLTMNEKVKGLLVYHQYGFPQKMDEICDYCKEKDLFIIEDCANVFETYHNKKHLGTLGDAAIFSLSKLFPSLLGGALVTKNEELRNYAETKIINCDRTLSLLTYSSRFLYECFKDTPLLGSVHLMQEMMYGMIDSALDIRAISLRVINDQLIKGAMLQRKKNYRFLLDYFEGKPEYYNILWHPGVVTPYIAPFFGTDDKLKRIVSGMRQNGIVTGIYHFDVNRNLLNPKFEKCIWIPVHQGLNEKDMEKMCEIIKRCN